MAKELKEMQRICGALDDLEELYGTGRADEPRKSQTEGGETLRE